MIGSYTACLQSLWHYRRLAVTYPRRFTGLSVSSIANAEPGEPTTSGDAPSITKCGWSTSPIRPRRQAGGGGLDHVFG